MTPKSSCASHGRQSSGQKAVAPLFSLDTLFFRAQSRIKSNALQRASSAQPAVGPLFVPELTGLKAKDRDERLAEYHRKLAHVSEAA